MTISAQPSAGHVAFGQDENAARFEVVNPILSADRRSTVGVVAVLTQAVSSTVQLKMQRGQEPPLTTDLTMIDGGSHDRVAFHFDLSNLPGPGEWVFTLLLGGDVLASGKLTVTDNGASTG